MALLHEMNPSLMDVLAICLCFMTIWSSARLIPKDRHHLVLAALGALCACLGSRVIDGVVSILFLGSALMLELWNVK